MKMGIRIDAFGDSVNKFGEELCGSRVEIIRGETGVAAILADGMGSGAKANLLAALAVNMMFSMLGRGEPIEEVADMIVDSQPAGRPDGVGYSAFTIIQATSGGTIYIAQMETPDVVLLYHGKPVPVCMNERIRRGKVIRTGVFSCRQADTVVAYGSGVLKVGTRDVGWRPETIAAYMANAYRPKIPAEKLARLLLAASGSLSGHRPENDLSSLVFRVGI